MTRPPKIVTHFEFPPIPIRSFDWSAVTDNYEGGDGYSERGGPIGRGATEAEAIAELLDILGEESRCKDKGGYVGPRGECLLCSADQGVACRGAP